VFWVLLQPFVTGPLLFGRTLFVVWLDLLDTGNRLLGINQNAVFVIVAVLGVIHLAIGAAAGWLAWDVARQLQIRLGKIQSESSPAS